MKIGIDIRPLRDIMTGIGRYQYRLLEALSRIDTVNAYTLYYNGFGLTPPDGLPGADNFRLRFTRIPRKLLTALWAYTSLLNVECLAGDIDIFYSPSFQVPPSGRAARVFTIFDLIVLTHPEMTIPADTPLAGVRYWR